MRKYFITGLILLLPLTLTIALLGFAIHLFTDPFVGLVHNILDRFSLLQTSFLFFSAEQIQLYVSRLLVLISLFFFIVLIGALARWFIVHYFIRWGEYLFHKIPFVGTIYKTSKDVIQTLFSGDGSSFKQVVLVPFPSIETYTIGFITNEEIPMLTDVPLKPLIAVFVPTTPNPTSGFLMMYHKEELIYLEMSIEHAFQYIVSCGVIETSFTKGPTKGLIPKDVVND